MAENLCESEKTAIAFSYFVVKSNEREFSLKNGIIFIDDPISSLDNSFIYYVFSLIKNKFNEVNQLFISTHNFQFFNLVKDWFIRKNKNIEEENLKRRIKNKALKQQKCNFYMIKNYFTKNNGRSAKLIILDNTLKNNKSEYSFLFKLLKEFNSKKDEPSYQEVYNISNISRRFLDIFMDFKIPTNTLEQKDKLNLVVKQINSNEVKISDVECDKLLWLINSFSHNSNPISLIEHTDKSESLKAVEILLRIVRESDKNHFEILVKNSSIFN